MSSLIDSCRCVRKMDHHCPWCVSFIDFTHVILYQKFIFVPTYEFKHTHTHTYIHTYTHTYTHTHTHTYTYTHTYIHIHTHTRARSLSLSFLFLSFFVSFSFLYVYPPNQSLMLCFGHLSLIFLYNLLCPSCPSLYSCHRFMPGL